MDAGGTSPRMGEGRTMQEQLSRVTQEQLPSDSAAICMVICVIQKDYRAALAMTGLYDE